MRMHVDRTPLTEQEPFQLADIRDHTRTLEDPAEDRQITRMARAAAGEVEHYAQIALLDQTITVTIDDPEPGVGIYLPVGPCLLSDSATLTLDGAPITEFVLDAGKRPYLRWDSEDQGLTPDRLVVTYTAGFGADAGFIPADLAQAICDQALLHYDGRSPMSTRELTMSPHMARIAAKYRGVSA